ncbi:type II secretion system F family protein [Mesorhizobium sp. KR2-14]|uniref:type II secretion system F family protein n=1 Tax=Mesorhizobium sp. KR2-14 TaxID=3156610 RepID=UPI0032B5EEF5
MGSTAFAYKALNGEGRLELGRIDASDSDDAVQKLGARGLIPVSVEESVQSAVRAPLFTTRIPPAAVTRLLSDLSIMLNAGIRIDEALAIMEREFDSGRLQPVVAGIRTDLASGKSFSSALEAWPALFPAFQVAMVRVAETSGKLPTLLSRIVEERQNFEALQAKVREALRYPAVLFAGTICVLVFFLVGVVPQFEPMIVQGGNTDTLMVAMFAVSNFLSSYGLELLLAVSVFVLLGFVAARQGLLSAWLWGGAKKLPLLSDIPGSYRTGRFARLLGIMVETGVAIPLAFKLITDTIDHGEAARARAQQASDALRQGNRLGHALEILQLPPLAVRMLRLGEQSGELAGLAYRVADFYEVRLERALSRIVGLVGPAAVATISILIGGMIVSIMSTLMSFNDMVR